MAEKWLLLVSRRFLTQGVRQMAVYKVEKGELVKVGETLESMVRADLAGWDDFDEDLMYKGLGFVRYDDEDGVYVLYRRSETDRAPDELPGVMYVFDVNIDESNVDYILVTSALPDFLSVVKMLEPLVARKLRLDAEFEKEELRRRR